MSTVEEIVNLPINNKLSNKSACELLLESCYLEHINDINEPALIAALKLQPSLADNWLAWSEDKRVDSGYYFKESPQKQYTVGHYSTTSGHSIIASYNDGFSAFTHFIMKEIEAIGK